MKGYSFDVGPRLPGEGEVPGRLSPWEDRVADAIGAVIEAWGFKHNHGRVWALLYLRGAPLSAPAIGEELDLSKGAVSMALRELEGWGVLQRVRLRGERSWHFVAENDFMAMVRRVVEQREAKLVSHVASELRAAEAEALAAGEAAREAAERVGRLRALAGLVEAALVLFLESGRLDFAGASRLLAPRPEPPYPDTIDEPPDEADPPDQPDEDMDDGFDL